MAWIRDQLETEPELGSNDEHSPQLRATATEAVADAATASVPAKSLPKETYFEGDDVLAF